MSGNPLQEDNTATRRLRPVGADSVPPRGQNLDLPTEKEEDRGVGRPSSPKDYFASRPVDPEAVPDDASLLIAEFFQRRKQGERRAVGGYQECFPEHGSSLAEMIR